METAEERKEGRKKEEEKCGDGRERWRAGERDWDSMVDSTIVIDIYSRVEDVRHCLEVDTVFLLINADIYVTRWHPTPVLLPGNSHGWRSLVGCSPWGRLESDTTERLHFHFSFSCLGEGNGTHSSVLAWRIPGTGEPGGLPSMGSHRVGHD